MRSCVHTRASDEPELRYRGARLRRRSLVPRQQPSTWPTPAHPTPRGPWRGSSCRPPPVPAPSREIWATPSRQRAVCHTLPHPTPRGLWRGSSCGPPPVPAPSREIWATPSRQRAVTSSGYAALRKHLSYCLRHLFLHHCRVGVAYNFGLRRPAAIARDLRSRGKGRAVNRLNGSHRLHARSKTRRTRTFPRATRLSQMGLLSLSAGDAALPSSTLRASRLSKLLAPACCSAVTPRGETTDGS